MKAPHKKILIIVLGSFAALAAALISMRYTGNAGFGKRQAGFAAQPDKEITGIDFSSDKEKLELRKISDSWIINENSEARENGISFITQILTGLEIKSPVSDELFDSVSASSGG